MDDTAHSSVESWILLTLINRDLDDGDYHNALLLSERLFAIDTQHSYYRFLYATCLFRTLDYSGTYMILRTDRSVTSLNLFAKSCLELAKIEQDKSKKRVFLEEGVEALSLALKDSSLEQDLSWGNELTSLTMRQHKPNRSSLCNLLGDLYVGLDNIRAAARSYWECLRINPYKISAYTKLCDIAPDVINFSKAKLPKDIFKDFPETLDLSVHQQVDPSLLPSADASGLVFHECPPYEKNTYSMPGLSDSEFETISIEQLRTFIKFKPKIADLDEQVERNSIEINRDRLIDTVEKDIQQMKMLEDYKNKHGLHKKPPVETPVHLDMDMPQLDENMDLTHEPHEPIQPHPPRLSRRKHSSESESSNKRRRLSSEQFIPKNQSISHLFLSKNHKNIPGEAIQDIVMGMNKVVQLLRIIANGYLHQSFYRCEEAVLELQKLDDRQYNSARILSIIGKAYYDAIDYQTARVFFRQSFCIAPWYCEYTPYYSTCLWYLQKDKELNILAYKIKSNPCHLYEAYIVMGNWTKCVKEGSEAAHWFKKAVQVNPSHFYAHALLGYEDWEKENHLGAKQHFAKSMVANKRSYLGWFGLANAYRAMEEYVQAENLLKEAIRLHPRHPVVLATMAEVLYNMEEYSEAKEYIEQSLNIRQFSDYEKLRIKILEKLGEC